VAPDVIHRVIEAHAVRHGSRAAIVGESATVTYHALNSRANALARALMRAGLRRRGHAVVTGEPGVDLDVAHLAELKTGASYRWTLGEDAAAHPRVAIRVDQDVAQDEYLVIDVTPSERRDQPCPNLPVMVRGGDVACLVQTADGKCQAISHASVAARVDDAGTPKAWTDEGTAVPLWMALMNGATITISTRTAAAA
jgi:non-ribosomal peptide synthetase component E (peptide arylation enzyme)